MTGESIIQEFTDNVKDFKKLALNIGGEQDAHDLFQTCSLMLLEFSEERLISYYNPTQGLRPFFIRMLLNQHKSKTSKFHKDYRIQEINLQVKREDILLNTPQSLGEYEPGSFEKMDEACQNIYYNAFNPPVAKLLKTVWELYVDTGSLRKTLAAVPEGYKDILNLKSVHVIVSNFQRIIKDWLDIRMV